MAAMPAANETMAMVMFMLVSRWIKVDRLHLATGEYQRGERHEGGPRRTSGGSGAEGHGRLGISVSTDCGFVPSDFAQLHRSPNIHPKSTDLECMIRRSTHQPSS